MASITKADIRLTVSEAYSGDDPSGIFQLFEANKWEKINAPIDHAIIDRDLLNLMHFLENIV